MTTFPMQVRPWVLALRTAIRDRFGTLQAFHEAYERSVSVPGAGDFVVAAQYVLTKKEVSRQLRNGRRYPGGPNEELVRRIVALCGLSQDSRYLTLQAQAAQYSARRPRPPGDVGRPRPDGANRQRGRRPEQPTALNGLPSGTSAFTGRADELRVLGRERFVVVSGLAGVGKSALALHFAHSTDFPGGQLYVDLKGYDPNPKNWLTPSKALANVLWELGEREMPPEEDQRSTLFRSHTAARGPMLIVIDNARSAQDVKPLLPSGHHVVVTSRHALIGLEDAYQLELRSLPPEEATVIVGDEKLAELCGRLPLALRIMAGLRKIYPDRDWVGELSDARLEVLDDEGGGSVRAAFDVSYNNLNDRQKRFFRLVTLHPTHEITVEGSALLADIKEHTVVRKLLRQLRIAHLVEPGDRFHDLVRDYAAELTSQDDEGDLAMDRFVSGFSQRAWSMREKLTTPKAFEAWRWFDEHRSTLYMTAVTANMTYRARQAIPLAKALVDYMSRRQDSELVTMAELAVDTAVNAKNKRAELEARIVMAYIHLDAGEDERAAAWFHTVWEQIHSSSDLPMVYRTLSGFATALERTGRHRAAENARRDLELVEQQLPTWPV